MKALAPQDPKWLGRNRMITVMGRGEMGQVLLGRSPAGKLVSVTQIHRQLAATPEFRERFQREIDAGRQLTGVYTATVVDSDTETESPWLATEYISGPDLGTVIAECGPLDLGGLRLLATGLAAALAEIHRAGLVHRDLGPSSVLLTPEGPRVVGFGIARALDGDAPATSAGAVIGSPAYTSPEQAEGRGPTSAADVFSIGSILTMASTGESPFAGKSTQQILYSVAHTTPLTARVPQGLRDLVDSCMTKDPAERPTADQLLKAAARIPAEPIWSQEVQDFIVAHRTDAEWWVQTTERESSYRDQLEHIETRRRRVLRWAGLGAVAVVAVGAAAFGITRWADDSGRPAQAAQSVADPALAQGASDLRLLDACKLLDLSLSGKLGTAADPLQPEGFGCSGTFTESGKPAASFSLSVGVPPSNSTPTGKTVAWAPMVGAAGPSPTCARAVTTQTDDPVTLQLSAGVDSGDACPIAEQALTLVGQQLAHAVPQSNPPASSILRLDPCTVLDPAAAEAVSGDPGLHTSTPHTCTVDGVDASIEVALFEGRRVDKSADHPTAVPVGSFTAYTLSPSDSPHCEVTYVVRPTSDDRAEQVAVAAHNRGLTPGACDKAEKVLADVISRMPRP
ncbi:serine/threonine-protein kinase [Nocardia sp. NPDC088792]|uniref:serine/threonine-protein kinase n=1 Tax=Nocardia sp. NPDC088792 TaxID=3364332 RepID=UPI00382D2F09